MKNIPRFAAQFVLALSLMNAGFLLFYGSHLVGAVATARNVEGDAFQPLQTVLASTFGFERVAECPKVMSTGKWKCEAGEIRVIPREDVVLAAEPLVKWLGPLGEQLIGALIALAGLVWLSSVCIDYGRARPTATQAILTPAPSSPPAP